MSTLTARAGRCRRCPSAIRTRRSRCAPTACSPSSTSPRRSAASAPAATPCPDSACRTTTTPAAPALCPARLVSAADCPPVCLPGLRYLQWVNDALHGITGGPNFHYDDCACNWNSSTSFPSPINFAATFDDDLAGGLGHWTGVEARAFTNDNRGGVDLWSPNINPFRDPRWGRGQEVPGEDPYTGGRYAFSYVQGMQRGEDPRYYLAVADCKHYAAYDLDHWSAQHCACLSQLRLCALLTACSVHRLLRVAGRARTAPRSLPT